MKIENLVKQQNLNNKFELNKIEEEKLKNEMDINMNIMPKLKQ